MIRIIGSIAVSAAVGYAEGREPLYQESLRPQFHFTARYWDDYQLHPPNHEEGWLNDMNGLVHFDGIYHFFAQRWWSAWLHAESDDLIHWKELRPAFGKGGEFGGTQSGGGVIDTHNTSGLGDGVTPPMIAFWSSTDNYSQCISFSLDRGETWSKYAGNPVLKHAFRDPKVFWHEPTSKWIMILYGPSDRTPSPGYGFNGEENDAHRVAAYAPGEWKTSIIRVSDNGDVRVMDESGEKVGRIDPLIQNTADALFTLGAKSNASEYLKGDISEVLIYDRVLTDEESGALMKGLGEDGIPEEGLKLHLSAKNSSAREGYVKELKNLAAGGGLLKQQDVERQPRRVKDGDGRWRLNFSGSQSMVGSAVLDSGDDSFTMVSRWRRDTDEGSQVICEQGSDTNSRGQRAAFLTVGAGEPENHYLLFSSTNLLKWERLPGSIPDSYECPDMFELPVHGGEAGETKWAILDANGDYITGEFDGTKYLTETEKKKGDFGRIFYATMTFENMPESDSRRIQLAWLRAWDDYPKNMPFNQQVSFPCELTLHEEEDGLTLFRYPIGEIGMLYGDEYSLARKENSLIFN